MFIVPKRSSVVPKTNSTLALIQLPSAARASNQDWDLAARVRGVSGLRSDRCSVDTGENGRRAEHDPDYEKHLRHGQVPFPEIIGCANGA